MKITPEQIREKIKQVDVSHRHVYEKLGISAGWFHNMIQGKFKNPNPKNMSLIMGFLAHYERTQELYKRHVV